MDPSDVQWDSHPGLPAPACAAASTLSARRSFFWSLGAVVVAGLLLVSLAPSERTSVEASAPRAGAAARLRAHDLVHEPGASDAREAAAKANLAMNPDDLAARLELAEAYLDGHDYMAAWTETQRVLARAPEDSRALAYQAQVRRAMGQPELTLGMLEKALGQDADLLQVYVYLSYVHLRVGQTDEAEAAMLAAERRFPERAAMLSRGFAAMREVLEAAAAAPLREGLPDLATKAAPAPEGAGRFPSATSG